MKLTLIATLALAFSIVGAVLGGAAGFVGGGVAGFIVGLICVIPKRPPSAPPVIEKPHSVTPSITIQVSPPAAYCSPKHKKTPLQWIGSIETITVGNFQISLDLVYVCDGESDQEEASAINTRLPVDAPARGAQAALGYYSRYQFLSPAQRGAYLEWLASGRRDENPETRDLGYVFLFIYGLERHLLVDGGQEPEVVGELVKLLDRYGRSRSLRSYVCQLVHFWGWKQGLEYYSQLRDWMDTLPVSLLGQDEMAIVLASLHLFGKLLPAALAYDVTLRHPDARRSVVVRRAEKELKKLFTKRYLEKFPGGMPLRARSAQTHIDYRPASPSLLNLSYRHRYEFRIKIPDVVGLTSQFTPLLAIWESCIEDLAGYSRVKAKEGAAASLKAHLALPLDLRAQTQHPLASEWELLLQGARRQDSCVLISVGEIAEIIALQKRTRLTPTQSRQVAEAIESFGFAAEPDARFSKTAYSWDQEIGVFQPKNRRITPPSGDCRGAQALLEMCVFIAAADGQVSPEEMVEARKFIDEHISLEPEAKERLDAFQHTLVNDPARAKDSFVKLSRHVPAQGREKIGHLLVLIAAADNVVTKDELRALDRAFSALGLSSENLEQLLASVRPEFREVSVQEAGKKVAGEAVPAPTTFALDMSRVAAISKETTEVIGLLSQVMAEEEESEPAPPPKLKTIATANGKTANVGAVPSWMQSIDTKYQPLLQKLSERESWTRAEFDSIAKSFHLMPLDAYDAVNEWADESLGDFLLDGEDPVTVSRGLISTKEPSNA